MEPPRHRAEGARPRGKGRIEPLESSFRRLEASFRRSFTRTRSAFASSRYYPCFRAPLTLPLGARPHAPLKRQTLCPRKAGAL